jgi:hypothetical protein
MGTEMIVRLRYGDASIHEEAAGETRSYTDVASRRASHAGCWLRKPGRIACSLETMLIRLARQVKTAFRKPNP